MADEKRLTETLEVVRGERQACSKALKKVRAERDKAQEQVRRLIEAAEDVMDYTNPRPATARVRLRRAVEKAREVDQ